MNYRVFKNKSASEVIASGETIDNRFIITREPGPESNDIWTVWEMVMAEEAHLPKMKVSFTNIADAIEYLEQNFQEPHLKSASYTVMEIDNDYGLVIGLAGRIRFKEWGYTRWEIVETTTLKLRDFEFDIALLVKTESPKHTKYINGSLDSLTEFVMEWAWEGSGLTAHDIDATEWKGRIRSQLEKKYDKSIFYYQD